MADAKALKGSHGALQGVFLRTASVQGAKRHILDHRRAEKLVFAFLEQVSDPRAELPKLLFFAAKRPEQAQITAAMAL